jgi:hypothetical protein
MASAFAHWRENFGFWALDFGPNQSKIRNPKSKMAVSPINAFALSNTAFWRAITGNYFQKTVFSPYVLLMRPMRRPLLPIFRPASGQSQDGKGIR